MSFGGYGGFEITSEAGLKLGDVLRACLTTRGRASSSFAPERSRAATICEAMDVIKEQLGSESIPKSPYMVVRMNLLGVGPGTPLVVTDEDRAAANVDWKPLR